GYNSYAGSVRGARGTLWSGAGNSLDDASLGVALMRASGVAAQYEEGTLAQSQAQTLILSMFPTSFQTVGYVPAGAATSDPANSPQLLAETKDHFWFRYDSGSGMTSADPEFASLAIGQAATTSTNNFSEVPDSLREKTEISLTAEIYSQADAAFAKGTGLPVTETVVLDQTFNDVDLVGRPLTLGNLFNSSTSGTTFTATTNTYTPFLDVGDDAYPDQSHDQLVVGTNYQELLTNFPLGNDVLTGLFLNVTLSGPQGASQTFERTLADRIGYAARQNGGSVNVNADPNGAPLVGPLDVWSIAAQASPQAPAAALSLENAAPAAFGNVAQQAQALLPAERSAFVVQTRADVAALMASADALTAHLGSQSLVTTYFARPRIDVVSSSISAGPSGGAAVTFETDLRNESLEALPAPGQVLSAAESLLYVRGTLESAIESQLLPSTPASAGVTVTGGISAASVAQAAAAQNIPLVSIAPGDVAAVDGLAVSADAKARIAAAVGAGFAVVVPASQVTLSGTSTVAWFQINPATGEAIGVTVDGANGGLVEAAFLTAYIANKVGNVEDGFEDKLEQVGEYYADFAFQPRVLFLSFLGLISTEVPDSIIGSNPDIRKAQAIMLVEHTANLIEGLGLKIPDITAKDAFEAEVHTLLDDFETELKTNPDDPPIAGALANLGGAGAAANAATATGPAAGSIAAGSVSGAVTTSFVRAAGALTASWANTPDSTFDSASFTATSATVLGSGGAAIGSGSVTLASSSATNVSISGNVSYSLTGSGSLSLYGPGAAQLAMSGDWSSYSATARGTVTLTLTTAGLVLNGQTLPSGTYTITTNAVTLSGSGLSASPDFAGAASISVNGGLVNLGGGSGSLTIGGTSLDPAYETTFDGYSGTVSLTAGGNATDSVQMNGSAANAITVAPTATFTTDQNTLVTFAANVRTTAAGNDDYLVRGPAGWTTSVDQAGNVSVTPAPGTQQGTYPVLVMAQSTTDPNLISQATVEVTVMPTAPGMTLNVSRDTQFTVPFNGAQLPTAFRATIDNTGPVADTYNLTFSNVPSGFTVLDSGTLLTVPAGRIAGRDVGYDGRFHRRVDAGPDRAAGPGRRGRSNPGAESRPANNATGPDGAVHGDGAPDGLRRHVLADVGHRSSRREQLPRRATHAHSASRCGGAILSLHGHRYVGLRRHGRVASGRHDHGGGPGGASLAHARFGCAGGHVRAEGDQHGERDGYV
ncbi:MAG TPA: transglutaminase family protein, partial [Pirellulales bacterium]|nr:transglutaminase family protein [Pirellulales bacterium]